MASKFKIVPVKLKTHVKDMMALNVELLPENYPIEYWTILISQHHSFVAINKAKQVIGYCVAGIPCTQELKKDPKGRPTIVSLAVSKDYRGLKLGKLLLSASCASIQTQHKELYLNVRTSNTIAHNLYISAGFIDFQINSKYYIEEDGILMKKIFT